MNNELKKIIIYTDGACSQNPGPGGYAAVLIYDDSKKEISGSEKSTTNNRMEILAVVKALELLKYPCEVEVHSDSAYVVNSIEKGWIYKWRLNNWITSSKEKVKNIDLWERMLEYLDIHSIKFIKVKGHSTDEYNNRCDYLAKEAIKDLIK